MKTFDEAFDCIIRQQYDLINANLRTSKDYMQNEAWTTIIYSMSEDLIKGIVKSNSSKEIIVQACSILQVAFQMGVLTGIEMEKQ